MCKKYDTFSKLARESNLIKYLDTFSSAGNSSITDLVSENHSQSDYDSDSENTGKK